MTPYSFAGVRFARFWTWWGRRRAWRLAIRIEEWRR
jgi:hypothetical protein